ncbi:MAG: bifunctional phosphopantothenoylcysteine decarboxylase/phosphopantothenate--cysteine ligase CoaBC [Gammaproteobacteria bacterium]|nr:bifunctional phosphopantothenoylcysteine decarboxylase/phosphopantothenate--cysteine ligase CoaBC [Gammaproteobacteria bacterium]
MQPLRNKQVLLGVTGGIAAYKSAELCRRLIDLGAEVQVVMTPAATRFVGSLTFQALTGRMVRSELFDPAAEAAMGHIELARWADLVLVAPATADFMARLGAGMADDLLTTACLATAAPIAVAPAMNQQMWAAPASRRNARTLAADGVRIWGPGSGAQACGDTGDGRMLEPAELAQRVAALLGPDPVRALLRGRHLVITAGPTREAIDPVRYVSNHSSGKQGFALAAAAAEAGARVTLVAGPVSLETPPGVDRVDVESAVEMLDAARTATATADVFIGVAAVADYRPASAADRKIKRAGTGETMDVHLVANPDIIATLAGEQPDLFCVAFAAETHDLIAHARSKLERKRVALVVANDVSDRSIGFGSDDNGVTLVDAGGEQVLEKTSKEALSRRLVEEIALRLDAAGSRRIPAGKAS